MRYIIWGWAATFDAAGNGVENLTVLRELSTFVDDEDLYATDYLGGPEEENVLAAALERSGRIRFSLHDGEPALRILTEYIARRILTPEELLLLRKYTLGQWSDGMGESLFVPRGSYKDYRFQPLGEHDMKTPEYPCVEVLET